MFASAPSLARSFGFADGVQTSAKPDRISPAAPVRGAMRVAAGRMPLAGAAGAVVAAKVVVAVATQTQP